MHKQCGWRVIIGLFTAFGSALPVAADQTTVAQTPHLADSVRSDGPPLSLAEAVAEAQGNYPELVALRNELETVRLRPGQERFLAPPMLEGQIWQWPINSLNPWDTNMYMLMATQELPGRGKRALRQTLAQKDVALTAADIAARERQIVNEVKQAYMDLFTARQATAIHLASVDVLRQFADVSQTKYTTGRISQQDVLKAVVELSRVHDDLIMFAQEAAAATAKLNAMMGRPMDAAIGPLEEPHELTLVTSLVELQALALKYQPQMDAARLAVDRAEAELAVARSDYKPDFSVSGGYLVMPRQTDAWLGKIGITWPRAPWSRGRVDARIAEMTAAIETAKAREAVVDSQVRLAVSQAYVRVKGAEERAALLRTTILPQSRQTLNVSRVAYQTDRVEFLALLENQRTLLDSQLEYSRALSDLQRARADLEQAVGAELVPEMTVPVRVNEVNP